MLVPPVTVEGMPPLLPVVPFADDPMLAKEPPLDDPLAPPSRPNTPFWLTFSRV